VVSEKFYISKIILLFQNRKILMKNNILCLFCMIFLFISACKSKQAMNGDAFGEKIILKNPVPVQTILTRLHDSDKVENVQVTGKVSGVCQAKGCWMTLVAKEAGQPPLFVKFKDYGFFMPKDLSGGEVVMEGDAFKEITSVEELKHYAQDEGKPKNEIDAITQPKAEYKFMAKGVVIVKKQ
jgi:Domain of unknown function (DUF4920)